MREFTLKDWGYVGLIGLLVFTFGSVKRTWEKQTPVFKISESYEMERPKSSLEVKFDLSGREIHRYTIPAPATTRPETVGVPAPIAANGLRPPPGKITNNPRTKANQAKQAQAEAKKKNEAKKKAQALAKRKAELSVRMLGESRTGLSPNAGSGSLGATPAPASQGGFVQPIPVANTGPAVNKNPNEEDQKLSPGQWLSLLQNQPSGDNAVNFKKAKAYLGNKSYYYDVIAKLLVDSQADRQNFAYNILRSDVSAASFYFLANPTDELKKHNEIFAKVQGLFMQYKTKAQFSILNYALAIENPNCNLQAMAILTELSGQIQARSPSQTGVVGNLVSVLRVDDFKVFMAALKKLETNKNTEIAQNAKSVFQGLWPSTEVAAGN